MTKPAMRVLHVVPRFSPLTETFIYDLLVQTSTGVDAMMVLVPNGTGAW